MSVVTEQLMLGFRTKIPAILQTEASECGLACVAMVANFHGYRTDLASLRSRHPGSLKGATLSSLIDVAGKLGLATRAVRLDLADLDSLRLPCILHWNFNHFVVLKRVGVRSVTILDPARGERVVPLKEFSDSFTGVALEMWPNENFQPQERTRRVRLRDLLGQVSGLGRSLGQIFLLAFALEIFAIVMPFFMQWVIDGVLLSADRELLTTLAIGFGLLVLVQQSIVAIRAWAILYLNTTLGVQWQANVFTHLLRLPIGYFEKRHLGDVVSRVGSMEVIQHTLTTSFLEAILDGVMTIVTLAMIFIYSPTLAWVSIAAMALYLFARAAFFRPLRNATEEQIVHAARQQSHFFETVRGVRTIKLFHRYAERRASWLTLLVDQINAQVKLQKISLFYRVLNSVLFGLEGVLIIWLGARLVMSSEFSVGMLMAFMAYKMQFGTRVSSLIDRCYEIKMLQLQGERLADVVLTPTEETLDAPRIALSDANGAPPQIEVQNLRFRYGPSEPYVLDGVNVGIRGGESVAIVGPSGCGKTTLMNVMLGLHVPSEGEVRIGGISIDQLGNEAFRGMVGAVTQDDTLFAGSIADNISFFDPRADQEWIERCAQAAAIHMDIVGMPMGYNTFVGDMGSVLSGGQKQRVLLARALYKRPKILFLDEATSSLDLPTEHAVNAAIRELKVTRVIIAHRPNTIESADRVILLENGRAASA
jgi:ATP-binding cassette, subfamily B, bacterial CvaB/MchF/RaxB